MQYFQWVSTEGFPILTRILILSLGEKFISTQKLHSRLNFIEYHATTIFHYFFETIRPSPKITWIGPKGEIDDLNPDYTISYSGNILTIPFASPRFSGEYRCKVENDAGLRIIRGQLLVKGKKNYKKCKNISNSNKILAYYRAFPERFCNLLIVSMKIPGRGREKKSKIDKN